MAVAALAGALGDVPGRRPIFLAVFAAPALRGALSAAPAWPVAVQLLDRVGVGVFGALFPVRAADRSSPKWRLRRCGFCALDVVENGDAAPAADDPRARRRETRQGANWPGEVLTNVRDTGLMKC